MTGRKGTRSALAVVAVALVALTGCQPRPTNPWTPRVQTSSDIPSRCDGLYGFRIDNATGPGSRDYYCQTDGVWTITVTDKRWVYVHSLMGQKLDPPKVSRSGARVTWTNDDSYLRIDNGCGSEIFVLRDSARGHKVTCGVLK